jgi:hypothetical protein
MFTRTSVTMAASPNFQIESTVDSVLLCAADVSAHGMSDSLDVRQVGSHGEG